MSLAHRTCACSHASAITSALSAMRRVHASDGNCAEVTGGLMGGTGRCAVGASSSGPAGTREVRDGFMAVGAGESTVGARSRVVVRSTASRTGGKSSERRWCVKCRALRARRSTPYSQHTSRIHSANGNARICSVYVLLPASPPIAGPGETPPLAKNSTTVYRASGIYGLAVTTMADVNLIVHVSWTTRSPVLALDTVLSPLPLAPSSHLLDNVFEDDADLTAIARNKVKPALAHQPHDERIEPILRSIQHQDGRQPRRRRVLVLTRIRDQRWLAPDAREDAVQRDYRR